MFRSVVARASAMKGVVQAPRRGLACATMYIKGISLQTTEDSLKETAQKYGPVYSARISKPRDIDMFAIGFIVFYAGDLPSSIEEIARLTNPPKSQINDALKCGHDMAGDVVVLDGCKLEVLLSKSDRPNKIQQLAKIRVAQRRREELKQQKESKKRQKRLDKLERSAKKNARRGNGPDDDAMDRNGRSEDVDRRNGAYNNIDGNEQSDDAGRRGYKYGYKYGYSDGFRDGYRESKKQP